MDVLHHGTGTFTYANGNTYEGQWQDGKFRGVKSSQMDGAAPIVAKDGWN